jgi:hypothetical protein
MPLSITNTAGTLMKPFLGYSHSHLPVAQYVLIDEDVVKNTSSLNGFVIAAIHVLQKSLYHCFLGSLIHNNFAPLVVIKFSIHTITD